MRRQDIRNGTPLEDRLGASRGVRPPAISVGLDTDTELRITLVAVPDDAFTESWRQLDAILTVERSRGGVASAPALATPNPLCDAM